MSRLSRKHSDVGMQLAFTLSRFNSKLVLSYLRKHRRWGLYIAATTLTSNTEKNGTADQHMVSSPSENQREPTTTRLLG
jgi:hypothetical protein